MRNSINIARVSMKYVDEGNRIGPMLLFIVCMLDGGRARRPPHRSIGERWHEAEWLGRGALAIVIERADGKGGIKTAARVVPGLQERLSPFAGGHTSACCTRW